MKSGLRARILLLLGTLLLLSFGLFAGELLCRLFSKVRLQGNSRDLFVADAYGGSKGNAPNIEAVSFGTKIYTDRFGFRVPPSFDAEEPGQSALLILGDSVAFGGGVEEQATFAGRLRESLPGMRIYNSSVIGYNTRDYEAVFERFLEAHDEIRAVVLLFCLNDVAARSAQLIDRALDGAQDDAERTNDFIGATKQVGIVRRLNAFLRSRSKLFLVLKNALTDPEARYWRADAALYDDDGRLARSIRPLTGIAATARDRGLPFFVVVAPYEFQLRRGAGSGSRIPQQKLARLFEAAEIEYVDALPVFEAMERDSGEFFLPGDPMHLSELGHRVVHDIILERLSRGR